MPGCNFLPRGRCSVRRVDRAARRAHATARQQQQQPIPVVVRRLMTSRLALFPDQNACPTAVVDLMPLKRSSAARQLGASLLLPERR